MLEIQTSIAFGTYGLITNREGTVQFRAGLAEPFTLGEGVESTHKTKFVSDGHYDSAVETFAAYRGIRESADVDPTLGVLLNTARNRATIEMLDAVLSETPSDERCDFILAIENKLATFQRSNDTDD